MFIVKQLLWLIMGSLMAIVGSIGTTYAIFRTGSAGIKEAEGPIKNIIDKAEQATKNIIDAPKTEELLKQINEMHLLDVVENSLKEMNKLAEQLKQNPELADGILLRMFSLLEDCKASMQPDEFKSYLRKVAMLFHPDKLKNLRNISEEDANKIYQLTTDLLDKEKKN